MIALNDALACTLHHAGFWCGGSGSRHGRLARDTDRLAGFVGGVTHVLLAGYVARFPAGAVLYGVSVSVIGRLRMICGRLRMKNG